MSAIASANKTRFINHKIPAVATARGGQDNFSIMKTVHWVGERGAEAAVWAATAIR